MDSKVGWFIITAAGLGVLIAWGSFLIGVMAAR